MNTESTTPDVLVPAEISGTSFPVFALDGSMDQPTDERTRDARIRAAAPRLLEALQRLTVCALQTEAFASDPDLRAACGRAYELLESLR